MRHGSVYLESEFCRVSARIHLEMALRKEVCTSSPPVVGVQEVEKKRKAFGAPPKDANGRRVAAQQAVRMHLNLTAPSNMPGKPVYCPILRSGSSCRHGTVSAVKSRRAVLARTTLGHLRRVEGRLRQITDSSAGFNERM